MSKVLQPLVGSLVDVNVKNLWRPVDPRIVDGELHYRSWTNHYEPRDGWNSYIITVTVIHVGRSNLTFIPCRTAIILTSDCAIWYVHVEHVRAS
jgi:hypothetical protein